MSHMIFVMPTTLGSTATSGHVQRLGMICAMRHARASSKPWEPFHVMLRTHHKHVVLQVSAQQCLLLFGKWQCSLTVRGHSLAKMRNTTWYFCDRSSREPAQEFWRELTGPELPGYLRSRQQITTSLQVFAMRADLPRASVGFAAQVLDLSQLWGEERGLHSNL